MYSLWNRWFVRGFIWHQLHIAEIVSGKTNPISTPAEVRKKLSPYREPLWWCTDKNSSPARSCVWTREIHPSFNPRLPHPGAVYRDSRCRYPGAGCPLILLHPNGQVIFCPLPSTSQPGASQGPEVCLHTRWSIQHESDLTPTPK